MIGSDILNDLCVFQEVYAVSLGIQRSSCCLVEALISLSLFGILEAGKALHLSYKVISKSHMCSVISSNRVVMEVVNTNLNTSFFYLSFLFYFLMNT